MFEIAATAAGYPHATRLGPLDSDWLRSPRFQKPRDWIDRQLMSLNASLSNPLDASQDFQLSRSRRPGIHLKWKYLRRLLLSITL
jgi:hypothetical protein